MNQLSVFVYLFIAARAILFLLVMLGIAATLGYGFMQALAIIFTLA